MATPATRFPFFNKSVLRIVGILTVVLLAVALLWYGQTNSWQSNSALVAQIYFDGEYRVADGAWQEYVEGEHIPSTKGDVTFRGNFHMLTPYGDYVGVYRGEEPIAFYADHINLTFYEVGYEPCVDDLEDPQYGVTRCGVSWRAYTPMSNSEDLIEIKVHNPHQFGNETAIDQMMSNIRIWTVMDFEKEVLARGENQRNIGLATMIVSVMFLGTALFLTLIHIKNSKIIWVLGAVSLFAGIYLSYQAAGVSFWSESIVFNTTVLGCSMMLYMLFLSIAIVYFLGRTKTVGTVTLYGLSVVDALLFALPMLTKTLFYDTWLYWVIAQGIANVVLLGCLIKESCTSKGKERWQYIVLLLPPIFFFVDAVMTVLGVWEGGVASSYIFIGFFAAAIIAVLRVIPRSINALAKAKELETEKIALNAQLTESRVATMISQIRPHFIYNTLGSIEQLCSIDPPKAGELVHNFAKYLRGNFGELDNPKTILMSKEMEHVRYYISIEKVRFPDMTFSFALESGDFHIPALTIQPIVENAIKHGLMKLPRGGEIRVTSYETDTHYCVSVEDNGVGFDTAQLQDDRAHVGIRNIRGRLKAMVAGELEIESAVGVGTKVRITIPKGEEQ